MAERVEHQNIYAALASAQHDMGPLIARSINPHFKSQYANINAVLELIREPLNENGLVVLQGMATQDGRSCLVTSLAHIATSETLDSIMYLPAIDDPQKIGSAITYYRRYQLLAMFNLNAEDDDGNEAQRPSPPPKPQEAPSTLRKNPPDMDMWKVNVQTMMLIADAAKQKQEKAHLAQEAAQSQWPTTHADFLIETVADQKFEDYLRGLMKQNDVSASHSPGQA